MESDRDRIYVAPYGRVPFRSVVLQAARDLDMYASMQSKLFDALDSSREYAYLGTNEYYSMANTCNKAYVEAPAVAEWLREEVNACGCSDHPDRKLYNRLSSNAPQLIRFGHNYMRAVPCLTEIHYACGITHVVSDDFMEIGYRTNHDMFRLYDAYRAMLDALRHDYIPGICDPDRSCTPDHAPWAHADKNEVKGAGRTAAEA